MLKYNYLWAFAFKEGLRIRKDKKKMSKSFDDLLAMVKQCPKKKVSVAVAQDNEVLLAVKAAKEQGIADSILVGDADKIAPIAAELGMDLADYEVIDVKDPIEASLKAVSLVHDGVADMYMKGLTPRISSAAYWTRKSVFVPAVRCLMFAFSRSRAWIICSS